MAFITAETRSSIVELAMGMLNQAPSTAMLNTLIAKSVAGATLQDLADYIATTDAFTAEYPATQTAREFASEMFGKLITGGTLSAELTTAVVDILEGLLIAGTTKAEGFVAVINFLSNSANVDHPDLGDIAQAFQNRADAAEYFSITKELGDSTDAELAAAIASVTSAAATLTAANAAADAAAVAAAAVPSQTFALTTSLDTVTGGAGDDTINAALDSSGSTWAATDLIDGGEGTDTLSVVDLQTGGTAFPAVLNLSNVENLVVRGADDLTVNVSGYAFDSITLTQSVDATVTAKATSDVTISGATGNIDVNSGNDVTASGTGTIDIDASGDISATSATAAKDVTIGATTAAAGTVSVTKTKAGASSIAVDGGTDVTISVTGSSGGADTITVGQGGAATFALWRSHSNV